MNYLSKNEKSFVHYVNICIQLETQTATTYAIFYKQAGLVFKIVMLEPGGLGPLRDTILTIVCRNDELSSTMS